jgi:hypothetical protein
LWIDLSAPFTINLAGHPLGKVGEFYSDGYPVDLAFLPSLV